VIECGHIKHLLFKKDCEDFSLKLKFPNQDQLMQDLADKLVDNIANLMDEYTIYFAIASYFLLVICLNVLGNVVQIINEHLKALFSLIGRIINYFGRK
jgi:hypothetical protein